LKLCVECVAQGYQDNPIMQRCLPFVHYIVDGRNEASSIYYAAMATYVVSGLVPPWNAHALSNTIITYLYERYCDDSLSEASL